MDSIGDRIKSRRKELKLTIKNIHETTGLSIGNISDMENNKYAPSTSSLIPLSKVLECSIDWILTGENFESEYSAAYKFAEQTNMYNSNNNDIGERIKWLRLESKLSQKDFSQAIKVGQSRLSEFESNKTKPSFETLYSIKEVFKVSLDWLICGEGTAFPDNSQSSLGKFTISEEELEILDKIRSGFLPIFDNEIKRLTGEVGRLNDEEHDMILKLRELDQREQEDIYDHINWKYEKSLRKKVSSPSMNGEEKELRAESETA